VTEAPAVYVLDTGPLSHFAHAQWLGVLKVVLKDHRVLIPDVVADELRNGTERHQHLRSVLEADWIETVSLETPSQLSAFVHYERRLVGPDGRNMGECGVLALAETLPDAVAVIDDRVAVEAARGRPVTLRRTLGLLCDAIHAGLLTVPLVSALADDLLEGQYRLPFRPGGFAEWCAREGLF
jgi:predicted nucleic acid-binding protein